MKSFLKFTIAAIICIACICGCSKNTSETQTPVTSSNVVATNNVSQQESLTTASDFENPKYIMTMEVKQSHFSLDIFEHAKDAMNSLELTIMVDKDYYDMYEIGDKVSENFRWGSVVFNGSFGNWSVKVTDKQIVEGKGE